MVRGGFGCPSVGSRLYLPTEPVGPAQLVVSISDLVPHKQHSVRSKLSSLREFPKIRFEVTPLMNCKLLVSQVHPFPPKSVGLKICAVLWLVSIAGGCGGSRAALGHLAINGAIPPATVNTSYTANLVAQGGTPPYRFGIVSGVMPAGLAFAANTGAITGTPTAAGSFNFTVSVTDQTQSAGQQMVAMRVLPASISVSVNPVSSTLTTAATQQFTATVKNSTDVAVSWSTTIGSISPSGLYTAPSVIATTAATVVAVSAADPTKSASATVMVQAQGAILGADNRYCLSGDQPNFGAAFDGPAQLPTSCINTALSSTPSNGNLIFVPNGGDVQGAVDRASCGDVVALEAGGTFGSVSLSAKGCDAGHWITLRTSAPYTALPAEGTRISPCYAGVASLPGRPALNCPSTNNVMAKLVMTATSGSGPITFLTGANHYRLVGLEITRSANQAFIGNLAFLAPGATGDHVIFDRVWMHGTTQDDTSRGLFFTGFTYAAVVDSYVNDFHCESKTGSCADGQAMSGGVGDTAGGPYKIVNNFLEGSGETVIFGGGAATATPADIEIRRNHFFKPHTWQPGQPNMVVGNHGNAFVVRNQFELKNGQRVLYEGNLTDNVWGGFSQTGFAVLLTPKNQGTPHGSVCPLCQVTDVTIRYSRFSHMGGGFQIANSITPHTKDVALAGERYSVHDVVLDDIDAVAYAGAGQLAQISTSLGAPLLSDVQITHVTAFPTHMLFDIGNNTAAQKMSNIAFVNSIVTTGAFPVWTIGGGRRTAPMPTCPRVFSTTVLRDRLLATTHSWRFPPPILPRSGRSTTNSCRTRGRWVSSTLTTATAATITCCREAPARVLAPTGKTWERMWTRLMSQLRAVRSSIVFTKLKTPALGLAFCWAMRLG